jgi:peptide/nickel transport system permease protein
MRRFLIRRIIQGIGTLIVTMVLIFVILRLIPSDPATILLVDDATPEQVAAVRQLWGLDQPIYVQFVKYVSNLLQGDAGDSFQYHYVPGNPGTPAFGLVMERFPATIQLALTALAISLVVSIPLGIFTALHRDSPLDYFVTGSVLTIGSLPNFWLGLLLILFFSLNLHLLPTGGRDTPQSVILPAVTLSLHFSVMLTRLTRTEVARVMDSDYIRTARSKGLPVRAVVWGHAMKNAMLPLVTVTGLRLGTLLHGSVVTETVFNWPGIGRLMIESVTARDYPVVQVIVPISALVFVASNFLVDILYAWVDPRVRVGTK